MLQQIFSGSFNFYDVVAYLVAVLLIIFLIQNLFNKFIFFLDNINKVCYYNLCYGSVAQLDRAQAF